MRPLLIPSLAIPLILGACVPPCADNEERVDDTCVRTWDWPVPSTTLSTALILDASQTTALSANPVFPEGQALAIEMGLGGWSEGAGEARTVLDDLQPGHGSGSGLMDRRSVTFFGHHSDDQILDAESPMRIVNLDNPLVTGGARPQELYLPAALDAMARTFNHYAELGMEYVFVTGDNADSAQRNETRWMIDILDGQAGIHTDSGADDSMVDRWGNDPLAPWNAQGLTVPWYTVAGNHDLLINGIFAPDDGKKAAALGDYAVDGTRDLSKEGGPITQQTVADPQRELLDRPSLVAEYFDSPSIPGPVGHGFDQSIADTGVAFYVLEPLPGVPLRIIGLDTTNPNGQHTGYMSAHQFNDLFLPALAEAESQNVLVMVASHHEADNIDVEGVGWDGVAQAMAASPAVALHLCGHGHINEVRTFPGVGQGLGFVSIETAALADWPMQSRLLELVANGDGTLSIYGTMIDYAVPEEHPAWAARFWTAVDVQSRWEVGAGAGQAKDRNVEVIVPIGAGLEAALRSALVDRGVFSETL